MRVIAVGLDLISHINAIRFPYYFIFNIKQQIRGDTLVTVAEPIDERNKDWNTYRVTKLNDTTFGGTTFDGNLILLTEEHPFYNLKIFSTFTRWYQKDEIRKDVLTGVCGQLYMLVRNSKKPKPYKL